MDLSRTVTEINGDFSRKPLKKLDWWGYQAEQKVWRYLQPLGYNPPTWQTDGRTERRTDGHRTTAKTALTHSARGKNQKYFIGHSLHSSIFGHPQIL